MFALHSELLCDRDAFLHRWDEINALRRKLGVMDDVLLDPAHYLATTDWTRRPCSVLFWRAGYVVALMYATQHFEFGISTGYAIGGDFTGRGLLLCAPSDEAEVLRKGTLEIMASGVHGLHLRVISRNSGKIELPRLRVKYLDGPILGDRLVLGENFDEFLGTLGKHTRRNIRNYIRKAAEMGTTFEPLLSDDEYQAAVKSLNPTTKYPVTRLRVQRDQRIMALHNGGERFGLRSADGKLVSVLCGYRYGSRYHLITQINSSNFNSSNFGSSDFDHANLSVTLRGLTIQYLIENGCKELQFMGGTSLNFGRSCEPMPYRSIFVDKESGASALVKRLCVKAENVLAGSVTAMQHVLSTLSGNYAEEPRLVRRTALGSAQYVFAAKGYGDNL